MIKSIALLLILVAGLSCHAEDQVSTPNQDMHQDSRCYVNGQFDADLGGDDFDCAN